MRLLRPLVVSTAIAASALVGAAALALPNHPAVLAFPWTPVATLAARAVHAPLPEARVVLAPAQAGDHADNLTDDVVGDLVVDETVVPEPAVDDVVVDDGTTSDGLAGLASAPDPVGSPVSVALRFLQAVARGDELAAAHQLAWQERLKLSRTDPWVLERVVSDVRRHARLTGRSACRHARPYDDRSVLVACGPVRVLVKIDPTGLGGNGVLVLSGPAPDRYRHAHTFAYSTVAV